MCLVNSKVATRDEEEASIILEARGTISYYGMVSNIGVKQGLDNQPIDIIIIIIIIVIYYIILIYYFIILYFYSKNYF